MDAFQFRKLSAAPVATDTIAVYVAGAARDPGNLVANLTDLAGSALANPFTVAQAGGVDQWGFRAPAVTRVDIWWVEGGLYLALDATVGPRVAPYAVLTDDQFAAIEGANSPDAGNPFATMNDLPSAGTTTLFAPASVTVTAGSVVAGDIASVLDAHDGNVLELAEAAGADPLTVVFAFAGVSEFNQVAAHLRYAGGASHEWVWEAQRVSDSGWDILSSGIGTQSGLTWFNMPVALADNYINAGAVTIRWRHTSNGISSHRLYLDYVALVASLSGAGLPAEASQAEAEAGTEVAIRSWSPLRIWQAIAAKIGVSIQAYNANLTTWAGKTAPSGAVVGTTDAQTVESKNLTKYTEAVSVVTPAATIALNPLAANVLTLAMDQNTTLRLPAAPAANTTSSFLLQIVPTGAYSLSDLTDSASGDTGWTFWNGTAFSNTTPSIAGSGKLTELLCNYSTILSKWIVRYGIKES